MFLCLPARHSQDCDLRRLLLTVNTSDTILVCHIIIGGFFTRCVVQHIGIMGGLLRPRFFQVLQVVILYSLWVPRFQIFPKYCWIYGCGWIIWVPHRKSASVLLELGGIGIWSMDQAALMFWSEHQMYWNDGGLGLTVQKQLGWHFTIIGRTWMVFPFIMGLYWCAPLRILLCVVNIELGGFILLCPCLFPILIDRHHYPVVSLLLDCLNRIDSDRSIKK